MDFLEINDQIRKKECQKSLSPLEQAKLSIRENINIDSLVTKAGTHKIVSEETAKQALSMSLQARKLKKTLEESRMKIVRPHLDFQKAINQLVKDYTGRLEDIEQSLKVSIEHWLEAQSEFDNNFTDLVVEVEDGKLSSKTIWEYEVVDESKIPREFLKLDDKKVKDFIKKGIREIPGLKITENTQTTMRIKNG